MDKIKKNIDEGCLNDDYQEIKKPLEDNFHVSVAKINEYKEEERVNWAKKHQPQALKDFICHKEKAEILRTLVTTEKSSHYIIEGPPGVGKRTMARALLREDIGPEITEPREEFKLFHLKNALQKWPVTHLQLKVIISSQHIEVNLDDLKGYEADVVIQLFQEIEAGLVPQERLLQGDQANYGGNSIMGSNQIPHVCRAITLCTAEKLPKDSQLHIQSLLETFKGHCKVIFCCHDVSQLHKLSSVCKIIQLLPPSEKEIIEVLDFIAEQEDIELPLQLAKHMAEKSRNCLQQAIRSFEATWQSNYPFKDGQFIMNGWEEELAMMAKSIIEEQSPKRLFIVRQKLITLFEHNLSPDFIFSTLVEELEKRMDGRIKRQTEISYQEYRADNASGHFDGDTFKIQNTKNNFQCFLLIEEFIAKFMSHYKCYRGSLH
ncbi:replication factor C subunit 3-like [Pistacia vera]|uniref:replication factor C subunit 3-like n=1 Tax=Pistacia vera TaxID=55513 RepID=UPI0012633B0A|nr:replication factor C subunit 3-like [Pistacia vera]